MCVVRCKKASGRCRYPSLHLCIHLPVSKTLIVERATTDLQLLLELTMMIMEVTQQIIIRSINETRTSAANELLHLDVIGNADNAHDICLVDVAIIFRQKMLWNGRVVALLVRSLDSSIGSSTIGRP